VVAARNSRTKRCGFAFEARRMDGALLFRGGASCGKIPKRMITGL